MNARIIFTLAAAAAPPARGSLPRPTETEADLGISAATVRQAQTANPETLRNPSTETMTGVDPDYANKVLETMRESVSKPQDVSQPLVIQIGGQGQGGR
jgi:hypothetical protein